jgi:endonuclease-3
MSDLAPAPLADRIDALLPQTQCTRCGYPACRDYARAIARGEADINQCPPGGAAGIAALATLLGRAPKPLNPANGIEQPREVALIDEAVCIGCTKCILACPVDAIVGASKMMHSILVEECTGCELCIAPCPVDCISMAPMHDDGTNRAVQYRARYEAHLTRLEHWEAERTAESEHGGGRGRRRGARGDCAGTREKNRRRRMNAARRAEIFRRLREANPKPTTELEYQTPFQLLIAVILSAQATDVGVNKATRRLFPLAGTPQALLALGQDELKRYISTIGLFNAKAKNVIATCRILVEQHGGQVPRTREALEALPGVGRKTANVILNTAFGEATIAVDTHIFRVANRTGLAPGKTVRAVEDKLEKVVPAEFKQDAHHWLILHGRYVCKARKPDCPQCIIRDLCEYRHKTVASL